jgi:hypothetical protein
VRDLSIACELTPDEITAQRGTLLPGLLAQAAERIPVLNGFRWRFAASGEFLAGAAETMNTERHCCRFLRFVLVIEPDGGAMRLEITGPEGTAEFLETLLRA